MDSVYNRNCPSIYRGIVESNIDPENLGRCKIRVPSIHGELKFPADALPWARPIAASPVSKGRGNVNIPDVGDIVWVLFEGGVREFPVYFGGTYAKEDLSISQSIIDFYIEGTSRISYDRVNKKYSVTLGNSTIIVSENGIEIKGNSSVSGNLTVSGNQTISGDLIVSGDQSVSGNLSSNGTISAKDVTVRDKLNVSSLHVSGTATIANLVITGSCNREWRGSIQ